MPRSSLTAPQYAGTFGSLRQLQNLFDAGMEPGEEKYDDTCCRTTCGCYRLRQMNWKDAYGRPGGAFAILPKKLFLMIRLAFFVIWLATNAYAVYQLVTVYNFPMRYYLTKLTSWSALLLLAYLAFALYSTFMAQCSSLKDGKGPDTPCFVSITWYLQTTNLVIQPMVTLMYFALVHEWGVERGPGAGDGDVVRYSFVITVVGHGLNTVLIVADLLLSRNRLVLTHFVHALLFAAAYLIFTVAYFAAGGTNEDGQPYIYPALDWRGFGRSAVLDDCPVGMPYCNALTTRVVATLLILIGVPMMSLVCFCTYLVRRGVRRRLEASKFLAAARNTPPEPKPAVQSV